MSISAEDKQLLLTLARQAIAGHFAGEEPALPDTPGLRQPAASFVTLTKAGILRGCIGNLQAADLLAGSVRRNALAAAFNDFRFPPLTAAELSEVDIEVSLLSEAKKLNYADADDLCRRLRPGIDGVILRAASRGATFLPQVWEQLPTVESFLSHLCLKAGLTADFWRHGQPEIAIYQVEHFAEGTKR
ncbi:MAG: AmmeMemoRadiSam system protein A [Desulfobulbaceae bacterium]|jgi:AmmeMemoRadiSam system protein A|nr:AmmeMemoRadiSam system protein A [Desulfobulbaceae bacterium]